MPASVNDVRTTRSGIVFAAAVLGIAACGGGEQESADTAGLDPEVTEAVSESEPAPIETESAQVEQAPATEAPLETEAAAPTEAPAETEAAPDTDPPPAEPVVPAALQFTAPLVGGGDLDAATLADKPTVFWFWAPT